MGGLGYPLGTGTGGGSRWFFSGSFWLPILVGVMQELGAFGWTSITAVHLGGFPCSLLDLVKVGTSLVGLVLPEHWGRKLMMRSKPVAPGSAKTGALPLWRRFVRST